MRYKGRLTLGFIFIVTGNFVGVLNPMVVNRAIDYLREDVVISRLLEYAGLVILITLVLGIFRFMMRRTVIVVSRLVENDLRNDLFSKLQSLSRAYYLRNSTGDIMSRLTNDLNAVRSVLGPGLMYSVNTIATFIFVIIMMLRINPGLTALALLPVPLMAVVVNRVGSKIQKRYLAVQNQFARISTKVQENLSGIRIVKSYVLEEPEIEDFNRMNRDYITKNMAYAKIYAAFHPSMMLIIGMGIALILWYGGKLIIKDVITLGEFVAFNLYLSMLVWPSIALGWVLGIFLQGSAALQRLNLIIKADPDIFDNEGVRNIAEIRGDLRFKNLNFSYPTTDQQVISDVSLDIPAGQIIALVGRTGSGKSTLMHLITRTFDPDKGTLFVDNNDIIDIPLHDLRKQIGYIPQDTFLFSDSIRNNIAFGVEEVTQEEVEWAATMARMHDAITEFPKGYDTVLGERGINLSGGQKQRLAIARAIIKQPRILLLDDALSAVDTVTEEAILNNMRIVMQGKTCLWVSHRMSSIQTADRIVVIDDGAIREQGTHDELMAMNGIYADMYEKQRLEESLSLAE